MAEEAAEAGDAVAEEARALEPDVMEVAAALRVSTWVPPGTAARPPPAGPAAGRSARPGAGQVQGRW